MPDLVTSRNTAPVIAEWDHPLGDPNLEDAAIDHTFASLARVPIVGAFEERYRRTFRHKCWQYMSATSEHAFVAFAVGTAGFAGNGFVYVVEPGTGASHSKFAITPLARGVELAPSSAAGTHRFTGRGLAIEIDNLDGGRRFAVRIHTDHLDIDLTFTSAPTDEHHALCVPLAGNRWNYTHKFGAFGVDGTVAIDGRRLELRRDRAFGTVDFSKMYALRHAVWKWIALAGRTRGGKVIGLNLVDPAPVAPFSENAAWVNGKRYPLARVHVEVERPDDAAGPWRLSAEGLDVEMRAITHVEQKLDVPLLRHKLRHVVGAFSGTLTVRGERHELSELVGIAEDNDTWW